MHLDVSFCYNNLIISTNNDTRRYLEFLIILTLIIRYTSTNDNTHTIYLIKGSIYILI